MPTPIIWKQIDGGKVFFPSFLHLVPKKVGLIDLLNQFKDILINHQINIKIALHLTWVSQHLWGFNEGVLSNEITKATRQMSDTDCWYWFGTHLLVLPPESTITYTKELMARPSLICSFAFIMFCLAEESLGRANVFTLFFLDPSKKSL